MNSTGFSTRTLTALVIAGMIGSGIYTTTGFALADLQTPERVLMAWGIAGLIAICGAISYGALADRVLESGGEYLYLTKFVHPAAGFLAGWVSALQGFTGAAALAALTFEKYLLTGSTQPVWLPDGAVAASLILVLTACHFAGLTVGRLSQNTVVAVKLLALFGFVVWAFALWPNWFVNQAVEADSVRQALEDGTSLAEVSWLTLATSIMWISFSYTGFNSSIYVAKESQTGAHGVRRSMMIGTAVVTMVYLILNVIFLYSADPSVITGQSEVATLCAMQIGPVSFVSLLRIAICLGLASSVSSMLMMAPRVYRKMAEDGVFPKRLAGRGHHFRTAILIQGLAMVLVTLTSNFVTLLSYLSMTLSLCSAGTVGTLLFCRKDRSGREYPGLKPMSSLAVWIYLFATLAVAVLACYADPAKGLGTAVTVVTGLWLFAVKEQTENASTETQ